MRRKRTGGWKRRNNSARSSSKCHEPATRRRQPVLLDRRGQHPAGGGDDLAVRHQPGHRRHGRQRRRNFAAGAEPRAGAPVRLRWVAEISLSKSSPRSEETAETAKNAEKIVGLFLRELGVLCGSFPGVSGSVAPPLREGLLEKLREDISVHELERRLAGAVVAAAQHRDLVRDV